MWHPLGRRWPTAYQTGTTAQGEGLVGSRTEDRRRRARRGQGHADEVGEGESASRGLRAAHRVLSHPRGFGPRRVARGRRGRAPGRGRAGCARTSVRRRARPLRGSGAAARHGACRALRGGSASRVPGKRPHPRGRRSADPRRDVAEADRGAARRGRRADHLQGHRADRLWPRRAPPRRHGGEDRRGEGCHGGGTQDRRDQRQHLPRGGEVPLRCFAGGGTQQRSRRVLSDRHRRQGPRGCGRGGGERSVRRQRSRAACQERRAASRAAQRATDEGRRWYRCGARPGSPAACASVRAV